MHLDQQNYHLAYSHIKKLAASTTIAIFVAHPDVDALCAAKILSSLFVSDYIEYKLIPVQGFSDLTYQSQQIDSKCHVFINCGGMVDLSQILSIDDDTCIFIIDKNRPLNLDNLFAGVDADGNVVGGDSQVIVFDDGDVEDLREERAAYFALVDDYSSNSENEEEEEEEEDQNNDNERDETTTREKENNDNENQGNETDDEDVVIRKRRRSPTPEKIVLRRNRKLCKQLLREYYSLTFSGTPASAMLYNLTTQISKQTNNFLWIAIIGLTSQFLCGIIDDEQYLLQVELFNDDVKRFNNTPAIDRERFGQIFAQDADDFSIHYNPYELRLMLYRHWSLYDAMYHSDYIASKLRIWREQGRQRLRNLFAKMGFSNVQSMQKYNDCDLDLRRVLETRLEDVAVRYGIDKLKFTSFVRCFGFKTVLGASDAFYGISALAELSKPLAMQLKLLDHVETDGFYLALDSIDNIDLLIKGIDVAQILQKAIVRMGILIIEERLVKTLKNFRLVVLKEITELYLFINPLTLRKLALFMMEAMKQTGRSYMPFVIAALDKEADIYVTLGISEGKSHFAESFRKCADATRAKIKQDRFDCGIAEIGKEDIGKFMEYLQIFL